MTEELHHRHCVPCEGGTKPLSRDAIDEFMKKLHGWQVIDDDPSTGSGQAKLEKKYHFIDFKRALTFVNEVGDVAEFEGHHPDIYLHSWNKVTITLSTHAIKGLSENDFIVAAKIDQIIADQEE